MKAIYNNFCPACSSKKYKLVFSPDDAAWQRFHTLSEKKYQGCLYEWKEKLDLQVFQCDVCKHYWHHSQPDQQSLYTMYAFAVPLNGMRPSREPDAYVISKMSSLYKLTKDYYGTKPKLLDYGSGFGRWARAAVLAGFDVTAYEPSAERRTESESSLGFKLINTIEEIGENEFDVINLEQVLEHTHNPAKVLSDLRSLLALNGMVRITVPNLIRANAEIWKDFPFNGKSMHILSPYEHLQGFTPMSLEKLLTKVGLHYISDINVTLAYPQYQLRRLLGKVIHPIGQTMALVRFES